MSSSPLVRQLRRQLMSIAKRFSETYTLDRLRHAVFRQSRAVAALLPYRLVRQSAFDFDRLPPLEQARYALKLPVPTKLPSLGNPQLESVVFRRGSLPDVSSEEDQRFRLYHTAFHRERLEFVGDRLLGQASATACLLMAPVPTFPTIPLSTMPSSSTSNVIWLQQTFQHVNTNAFAAELGHRYGLPQRCHLSSNPAEKLVADRFEAFLTALWLAQGQQAVLEFLMPLLRQRIAALRGSVDAVPAIYDPTFLSTTAEGSTSTPIAPSPKPSPVASSPAKSPAKPKATPKFVTLVYPTLDLALHGFVAAFGRRGVPLVKANGRLRLEVPGRPVIAVASSASKYKAGDTPLSALLDLALKQDFVRIREPTFVKKAPATAVASAQAAPSKATPAEPTEKDAAELALPAELDTSLDEPTPVEPENSDAIAPAPPVEPTNRPTDASPPPAAPSTAAVDPSVTDNADTPSFAPLRFGSFALVIEGLNGALAKQDIALERKRLNGKTRLRFDAPGYSQVSCKAKDDAGARHQLVTMAVSRGIIIIEKASSLSSEPAPSSAVEPATSSSTSAAPPTPPVETSSASSHPASVLSTSTDSEAVPLPENTADPVAEGDDASSFAPPASLVGGAEAAKPDFVPLHFKSIAQARVDIFRRLRQVGINPQWTPDPYGGLDTETLVEVPGFVPIRVRAATRYERSRQVAVRAMRQGIIVVENKHERPPRGNALSEADIAEIHLAVTVATTDAELAASTSTSLDTDDSPATSTAAPAPAATADSSASATSPPTLIDLLSDEAILAALTTPPTDEPTLTQPASRATEPEPASPSPTSSYAGSSTPSSDSPFATSLSPLGLGERLSRALKEDAELRARSGWPTGPAAQLIKKEVQDS